MNGSGGNVPDDLEQLFADPSGRIVQLLGREQFRATSPRQFAHEYQRVYGQRLSDRTEALGQLDARPVARPALPR